MIFFQIPGGYPVTLNSLSVVTGLLLNIYKPVSDSYVNVILHGNVGWGVGEGEGNTHCCVGVSSVRVPLFCIDTYGCVGGSGDITRL